MNRYIAIDVLGLGLSWLIEYAICDLLFGIGLNEKESTQVEAFNVSPCGEVEDNLPVLGKIVYIICIFTKI